MDENKQKYGPPESDMQAINLGCGKSLLDQSENREIETVAINRNQDTELTNEANKDKFDKNMGTDSIDEESKNYSSSVFSSQGTQNRSRFGKSNDKGKHLEYHKNYIFLVDSHQLPNFFSTFLNLLNLV